MHISLPERPPPLSLQPFSAAWKASVQQSVDAFILSLPLGTASPEEIEEAIARRLYDAEIGQATAQKSLAEWYVMVPISREDVIALHNHDAYACSSC